MSTPEKNEAILELISELRMGYGKLQIEYNKVLEALNSREEECVNLKRQLHSLNTRILELAEKG